MEFEFVLDRPPVLSGLVLPGHLEAAMYYLELTHMEFGQIRSKVRQNVPALYHVPRKLAAAESPALAAALTKLECSIFSFFKMLCSLRCAAVVKKTTVKSSIYEASRCIRLGKPKHSHQLQI